MVVRVGASLGLLSFMTLVASIATISAAGSDSAATGHSHYGGGALSFLIACCTAPLELLRQYEYSPSAVVAGLTVVGVVGVQLALQKKAQAVKLAPIKCVTQRDDMLEQHAEASLQTQPLGAVINTVGHGVGTVVGYHAGTNSYDVAITQDGMKKIVTVAHNSIEQTKVKEFYIYPIKSCAGIQLDSVKITGKGILHDREWMFADAKGKAITARRYPTMTLIKPKLIPSVEAPSALVLTAKGMDDLVVPILRENHGKEANVQVWSDKMMAIDQGDKAAEWINKFLADSRGERTFRFFRVKDSFHRWTDPKYAPSHETGFADGFPFLLALQSSLDELNESLEEKVLMNRFRPNIVLSGSPPFADEHWNALSINGIRFRNVKPCARCNFPCVDPATGIPHPKREPTKTLLNTRNGKQLGFIDARKDECFFGSNMVAEHVGRLHIGDPVKVLTLKKTVYA